MTTQTIDSGISVKDWGRTRYESAFERQLAFVDGVIAGEEASSLIFTEHEAVYTVGTRKESGQNLLFSEEKCAEAGIAVARTNRGGDITYHGPGQLVGYPIISLQKKKDLHAYLRNLEQVLINALGNLGLAAARREGKTGIWLQNRKIAAIGVAVKRWVTYHGFALNVNNDLGAFQGIVPCGIPLTEGTVTSMKEELGRELDLEEVKASIVIEFSKIFSPYL